MPAAVFYIYLIIINITGFLMMGIDKRRARRRKWRISEASLFAAAWIGGSLGTFLGMHIFHHKTRHLIFRAGLPLIFIIQLTLLFFFFQSQL